MAISFEIEIYVEIVPRVFAVPLRRAGQVTWYALQSVPGQNMAQITSGDVCTGEGEFYDLGVRSAAGRDGQRDAGRCRRKLALAHRGSTRSGAMEGGVRARAGG